MRFFIPIQRIISQLIHWYTERKTDPKSRYFPMFESTFEKCLIQLSAELIQPDIVYD